MRSDAAVEEVHAEDDEYEVTAPMNTRAQPFNINNLKREDSEPQQVESDERYGESDNTPVRYNEPV